MEMETFPTEAASQLLFREAVCRTLCITKAEFSSEIRKWFKLTSKHAVVPVSAPPVELSSSGLLI